MPAQRGHNAAPPAVQRAAGEGQHVIRLQANVVHAIKHGRESRQPHRDHDALQVNAVSHVGIGAGDAAGRIKNGIDGLVERIPALEPASGLEVRFNGIQLLSQSHVSAFLLDSRQVIPENSAVFVFARAHIGAERQILFIEFEAAQGLSRLGVPYQQSSQ